MKIEKLQPGQTVWSVERRAMGNTTLRTSSLFSVKIMEILEGYVLASWNGNVPKRFFPRSMSKWRKDKPLMIATMNGYGSRLANRAEIAAHKVKLAAEAAEKDQRATGTD